MGPFIMKGLPRVKYILTPVNSSGRQRRYKHLRGTILLIAAQFGYQIEKLKVFR